MATVPGNNVGATTEAGEPAHAGNVGGHSVWWAWTAPQTGSVSIESSSTDTNGSLLKSSTGGGLWTFPTNQDLRIRVRGRYKYPGP